MAWRYRLGVRTDGSQPSDRGSNPRSATIPTLSRPSRAAIPLVVAALFAGCGAPRATRATGPIAGAVETALASGTERFDNSTWGRLLAETTRDGRVDYLKMQDRRDQLENYLAAVGKARLDRLAPAQLEALLIDAYNACTVHTVLEHPRIRSIREIPGVWTAVTHRVGGFDLTLDSIEHRILRPYYRDPRIHFALNCASVSCAPLPPWAIEGDRIEDQLEDRARTFLADARNARVERGSLLLSKYFDWYGADFVTPGWKGSTPTVADYVARYAAPEVAAFIASHRQGTPVRFLDYDWALNAASPAPRPAPSAAPSPASP
jgi:hypothetical protein